MSRPDSNFLHNWHVALNRYNNIGGDFRHWMYMAKELADEVPRLAVLHRMERLGQLSQKHRQCSHSPTEAVPDNHLTCSLGVKCRECPHLLAIKADGLTPEQTDEAKAWTCVAHIVHETKGEGDRMGEGWIQTVDDKMFWQRTYESMAQSDEQPSRTQPEDR